MSNDLVKVCKSSDEAKVQRKIFLVQRSFSEKRLQEKILSMIKDFQNPYPDDIFTWDNPELITDTRGKYNKMFFTIFENTKDDIVKALVEEELEHHAKEVELDSELEEKKKHEILKEMKKEYKNYGIAFDWEMCGEAIDRVFQKLKDEVEKT
jgi:hypothetical protein